MEVTFHQLDNRQLKYVVIAAKYHHSWLMVQHKERTTWEIPGGHIEMGETPDQAAKRELHEETGATDCQLEAICDYGVTRNDVTTFGRLYIAEVKALSQLPDLEIAYVEPLNETMTWTYERIQPLLLKQVNKHIMMKDGF